jgi:acetyl esterase/lipase
MKTLCALLMCATVAQAHKLASNIPYADPADERQVLDIYSPADAKDCPVVFWIHGGGWVTGDKAEVQEKPRAFTERGFVFVSTNYRLLPKVEMGTLIRDVAKGLGWVHKNIARYGGDPNRIFVMGHSAGAQLAAILCTDERYLKAENVSFDSIQGCVPIDGDTYDIPAMIETTEVRLSLHGLPLPTYGHRMKFGNDPKKHIDFSPVTHVAKGKGIPPFLILYVGEHHDVEAQAKRLTNVLKESGVPAKLFGAKNTYHTKLSADLGLPDDSATKELFAFLKPLAAAKAGKAR